MMKKNKANQTGVICLCIIYTAFVAFLWWMLIGLIENKKMVEEKGVDVVVTVDKKIGLRRVKSYYGSYTYEGKRYRDVYINDCLYAYVGQEVKCKIIPGDFYKAYCSYSIIGVIYIVVAVVVCSLVDLVIIYQSARYINVMRTGFVEIGIIKSVERKEKEFYAIVEFEDFNGNIQSAEINFGRKLVLAGQKCAIKYKLRGNNKAEAYYYHSRD